LAVLDFKKKFREKTKNSFDDKNNFKMKENAYYCIEVDFDFKNQEIHEVEEKINEIDEKKSKLNEKVQSLITLISDINIINNTMKEFHIDTKKM
jgi:poly [ADP-ribose] polymerase 2/3/4